MNRSLQCYTEIRMRRLLPMIPRGTLSCYCNEIEISGTSEVYARHSDRSELLREKQKTGMKTLKRKAHLKLREKEA